MQLFGTPSTKQASKRDGKGVNLLREGRDVNAG